MMLLIYEQVYCGKNYKMVNFKPQTSVQSIGQEYLSILDQRFNISFIKRSYEEIYFKKYNFFSKIIIKCKMVCNES